MKTNHTKDKLTPDLVSIDDTKPTKNEQSDVRGIVEELDNLANIYGWHKDSCAGHSHHPACPVIKLRRMITHLREQHEAEKRELFNKGYQLAVQHSIERVYHALNLEEARGLIKAQHHGLSTKE